MNEQIMLDDVNIEKLKHFFEIYELESSVNCNYGEKTYVGTKNERTCRFCLKKKGVTTFKKKAHLLPNTIGNEKLLSLFECDNCNSFFSIYEDALSKYLGAIKPVTFLRGKNKEAKHKEMNSGFKVSTSGNKIIMETYQDIRDEKFDVDEVAKKFTIKTTKQSYIPINVYKIFLKIVLSMIRNEEVDSLKATKNVLMSDKFDHKMEGNPFFRLFYYFIPGTFSRTIPEASLYKRREEFKKSFYPDRTLIMGFGNYQVQIFIPFSVYDKHMYNGETINVDFPIFPLIIDVRYFSTYGKYVFNSEDLSSSKIKKSQQQNLTFQFKSMDKVFDINDL